MNLQGIFHIYTITISKQKCVIQFQVDLVNKNILETHLKQNQEIMSTNSESGSLSNIKYPSISNSNV